MSGSDGSRFEPEPEPASTGDDLLGTAAEVAVQALEATAQAVEAGVQETANLVGQGFSQTGVSNLKATINSRNSGGYALLAQEDEDGTSAERTDVNDQSDVPVLGRYKTEKSVVYPSITDAAATLGFSVAQVAKCCENATFRADFRAKTGYSFKTAEEPRGKAERDPEWRVGRRKALDELETVHEIDAFLTLVLRSPQSGASSPGLLKVRVAATERPETTETRTLPFEDTSAAISAIRPCDVFVRLYAIRAFALSAKDAGNSSDPYVQATIEDPDGDARVGVWPKGAVVSGTDMGGKKVEISPIPNTLNPHFGQIFQWQVQLPGPPLKVVVKDHDDISEGLVDDKIGETTIDLENRFFSHAWHSLGHQGGYDMKFPIEQRDLLGESGVTQGVLECWVEIFPQQDVQLYPVMDISAPQKQKFELRVVVWDAIEMKPMDTIGDMNDLYVTGTLMYRDKKNKLKRKKQATDIHWRSQHGKGSFNYRLVYKDLELPMTMPGAEESEFPMFVVNAYDQDVVGGSDLIGTEQVPEIKDLFKRAWRKFEIQQERDQALDKMTVPQLRDEARELYDRMLRKTAAQLATANSALIKDAERMRSLIRQQEKQRRGKEKVPTTVEIES